MAKPLAASVRSRKGSPLSRARRSGRPVSAKRRSSSAGDGRAVAHPDDRLAGELGDGHAAPRRSAAGREHGDDLLLGEPFDGELVGRLRGRRPPVPRHRGSAGSSSPSRSATAATAGCRAMQLEPARAHGRSGTPGLRSSLARLVSRASRYRVMRTTSVAEVQRRPGRRCLATPCRFRHLPEVARLRDDGGSVRPRASPSANVSTCSDSSKRSSACSHVKPGQRYSARPSAG